MLLALCLLVGFILNFLPLVGMPLYHQDLVWQNDDGTADESMTATVRYGLWRNCVKPNAKLEKESQLKQGCVTHSKKDCKQSENNIACVVFGDKTDGATDAKITLSDDRGHSWTMLQIAVISVVLVLAGGIGLDVAAMYGNPQIGLLNVKVSHWLYLTALLLIGAILILDFTSIKKAVKPSLNWTVTGSASETLNKGFSIKNTHNSPQRYMWFVSLVLVGLIVVVPAISE